MEQQISNTRFSYYTDTFGSTAQAGIKSAQSLYQALDPISRVRFSSFEKKVDACNATTSLLYAISSSYENIFTEAHSITPMLAAFTGLSDHIRKWSGLSIDDYLTNEGIQVNRTYANIVNSIATRGNIGTTAISSDNIVP